MAGSSFGTCFRVTTWGESHGRAIGVVVDGCPPGICLDEARIQADLDRRRPGQTSASTSRKEPDIPVILSGVFEGMTTGTPIMIEIKNRDADSRAYSDIARVFRPGHGDITYHAKYGIRDFRGGGRASARETASRVAAGAVAQAILDGYGIRIDTCTLALGGVRAEKIDWNETRNNRFECPDPSMVAAMETRVKEVKGQGDSIGGVVEIRVTNVPPGLGEPVFEKLDAMLAGALMGIGAVKAVEIGAGCGAAQMTGSQNNDQILSKTQPPGGDFSKEHLNIVNAVVGQQFQTNNSGGILAGISNGDEIIARVHVKPIPSITMEQQTVDETGRQTLVSTRGRHDVSAIPRINPVCKAMVAIVLADLLLRQKTLR
ncbi:AroC2 [Desulforapulum autotrophicum HRM2]|uniref:Chorismate synthase n=1 Tax=Desulforapulum autotrophicum (strain ATCC 43914 / DSM 3382 / VKM B-1955 / HRM2) TaxID=177437 RepID=C0QEK8_DESAH|nr:chorismate synthase [Desulforapulum autotrophicum]ACN15350.1 AroC2 [Desulforapulum autotrophicum HRM2]